MTENNRRTHPLAILSLLSAVLTVLSFCIGVLPPPGTGWVCFPSAVLLGAVALLTGIRALRGIRSSGQAGRGMALAGAWIGGLTIVATVCVVSLTGIALIAFGQQLWAHLHP